MRVFYNGIDMMAIETQVFSGEPVYDDTGVDYLYTKYLIHVTGVINTERPTSDVFLGTGNGFMNYGFTDGVAPVPKGDAEFGKLDPRPAPIFAPLRADLTYAPVFGVGSFPNPDTRAVAFGRSTPVLTHEAIRHRLEVPRGQLYVFSGTGLESGTVPPTANNLILRSPADKTVCDAKNGPLPRLMAVTMSVGGTNTMVVEWACETFVNEAQTNNVDPFGYILSNRFSQVHSVDQAGFTTVATQGITLFRTDRIMTPGARINPDSLRARLFVPIPQGFERVVDYVRGRPDVSGIEYRYTDVQVPVNFVAGPYCKAADITAVHKQSVVSDVNPLNDIADGISKILNLALTGKWLSDPRPASTPAKSKLK